MTARDLSDMGRLAQLAANPQGTTREEIFLAVASLYRVQGTYLNARERELMREILRRLAGDVEMAIRIALAERLADDASVPHDLILLLADDKIEVARPLILRSPLLTEADVLRLIAEYGEDHQEAVASRANIGEPVSEALSKSNAEPVLTALVRNVTAKIPLRAFETLIEKSRQFASLQDPLVRREDLPPVLATKMSEFVSEALKIYIQRNYRVAPPKLDQAVDDAADMLSKEPAAPKPLPGEGAQKLIDKLAASGQLKAGFLMRVLHQGQIDLFDLAFAKLLNLPLAEQRKKFYESGPRPVALACRAVGIDRCVFPTVFNLSRQARNMRAALSQAELTGVQEVFADYSRSAALNEIRSAL
ncbi:MAG TPA: DUF2336 domain-containing protein [Rhizomicrobium sp.]|nr:DUF2336 domain-containing protein [Rhizomicrobium sp.]